MACEVLAWEPEAGQAEGLCQTVSARAMISRTWPGKSFTSIIDGRLTMKPRHPFFETDLDEAVSGSDAVFLAAGTVSRQGDGHADGASRLDSAAMNPKSISLQSPSVGFPQIPAASVSVV